MEVKFLGQGFEEESPGAVGHHLLQFLTQRDYHTFTAISAFAGESGIQGLFNKLEEAKSYFQYINLIIGVDMKGTSKEALEAILRLDINSFVFYNKTATIFHPKIYLFEGDEKAEIIIGSSNLTAKGLFQNVEASVLISIIKSDPIDLAFLDSVKAYFAGLFDFSDPNLQRLSNELIEYLVEANIVPLEKERREMQEKTKIVIEGLKDSKIEFFPPRQVPKIPPAFLASIRRSKKEVARPIPQVGARPSATEPLVSRGILVWIKNKLPN
ncbi:MAG: restriction endonuclease PLD domain-containing protein [Saprospiraceae bacterium]